MALKNLKTEIKGSKLIVEIDVGTDTISNAPQSATGKSKLIASTGSIQGVVIDLPSGLKLNLNVTASIKNAKVEQQAAE